MARRRGEQIRRGDEAIGRRGEQNAVITPCLLVSGSKGSITFSVSPLSRASVSGGFI